MLGHLMEWFYSGLAGIRQAEASVAYRDIVIRPEPVGNIVSASASYQSPYGEIVSDWKKESGKFFLNIEIPVNSSANVYFPVGNLKKLTENGTLFKAKIFKDSEGRQVVRIGSGKYRFSIDE